MSVYDPGVNAPGGNVTISFCGRLAPGLRLSLPGAVAVTTVPSAVPSGETFSVYVTGFRLVGTLPTFWSGTVSRARLPNVSAVPVGPAFGKPVRRTNGACTLTAGPAPVAGVSTTGVTVTGVAVTSTCLSPSGIVSANVNFSRIVRDLPALSFTFFVTDTSSTSAGPWVASLDA